VIQAFQKCLPQTRNRSKLSENAFPPRETDQNFPKTPSRGGKPIKTSEKRLPAAGNGVNSQKNAFPRREMGKILRKTVSRGGKWEKISEKRFPAAGNGGVISKKSFPRRDGFPGFSPLFLAGRDGEAAVAQSFLSLVTTGRR